VPASELSVDAKLLTVSFQAALQYHKRTSHSGTAQILYESLLSRQKFLAAQLHRTNMTRPALLWIPCQLFPDELRISRKHSRP